MNQFTSKLTGWPALMSGMLPVLSVDAQAFNLALNKPVTCSSTQFPSAEAVDKNAGMH